MEARAVRRMSSGGEEDNRSVSSGRGSWASGAEDKRGFIGSSGAEEHTWM